MALVTCPDCGSSVSSEAVACPKCGRPNTKRGAPPPLKRHLSRTTAGLLALLLGGVGVHRFYLGKPFSGLLYLLFCWTLIPALFGILEGISLLAMSDKSFIERYCM